MNITSRKPMVYYGGESLGKPDAVIPRIGASNTFYGTAVVRQFEMMNSYCVNSSVSISNSRDKLRSLQILAKAGINMPVTGFASHTKDIEGEGGNMSQVVGAIQALQQEMVSMRADMNGYLGMGGTAVKGIGSEVVSAIGRSGV